ncbi:MAG: helix-turn-helix transcriptional regulator [Bacteroidetes bacterium]|nr:helix-turn-helix transcriptional regulator [Bacteroidota bacterium]
MVIDYKKFELYGKIVFEKAVIRPPFSKPNIMEDEACFLHILEGVGIEVSENNEEKVLAKESILMKCGNYVAKMRSDKEGGVYSAFAVHFYPDVLKTIYHNDLPKFLKSNDKDLVKMDMTKVASNLLIDKFIQEFLVYFDNPSLISSDLLELKLKEIILLLHNSQNGEAIKLILSNLFSPQQYSLQQIVETHLYRNITVEELATICNMSISTFKREFKKAFNDNPANYIRAKKMVKAKELIKQTNLRINEIAEECGYEDVSHFSNTFFKFFGKYPTFYRLT